MIFQESECERIIGYVFKNKQILRQSFTHSSYANEHGEESNERLEFLGDSVLGFLAAEHLYGTFRNEDEGALTQFKQAMVSTKPLVEALERTGLSAYILYGNGEVNKSAEEHKKMSENLFESIVGALYLDGGMKACRKFVQEKLFDHISYGDLLKVDFKSKFQEYVQKRKLGTIEYVLVDRTGEDHKPTFEMALLLDGEEISRGKGRNKSEATKEAAEIAWKKMKTNKKSEEKKK